MITLPPIKVAQGEPYIGEFTLTGQDWTGFTAEGVIKRKPKDDTSVVDFTPSMTSLGVVSYTLTEEQTADLPAVDKLGTFPTCVGQIRATDGSDVFTFQFVVGVARAL